MEKILRESIDFSKTPEFNQDDFKVEVKGATLDRDSLVLHLVLELNFIVRAETAEEIKSKIRRAMPDIKDVDLTITYKDVKGSEIPAPEKRAGNGNGVSGGGANGNGGANSGNGWKGGNGKGKGRSHGYRPVKGNIIMGNAITIDCMPLDEIESESGTVAFEGELFRKDARTVNEGRKLASLYVTNKKNSICVKAFVHNKKWEDIVVHLPEGSYVKIR